MSRAALYAAWLPAYTVMTTTIHLTPHGEELLKTSSLPAVAIARPKR